MKKTLSMITLAVLTVGLLASCAKINERLDDLEKKVDGLENEKIASIDSQVESIESSISDLKSIRDKVQAMSDPATGLGKRIKELEAFASDVKKNYATQDWAKTTLVTMEEYEKTCDTVAKIAAKVEGFDSDIKACADSLKRWVNEQFGGYYDIATIDAKLAELQEQVDGVDSLSAELAKTKTEIDTAKAAIRAEYRAVIASAIENSEGKLTKALQDSIDNVNATIGPLTGRVDILETAVTALSGKVDSLENMIQTVTIVPAFSDGSVEVKDDTLFIDCIISPVEAVKVLDTADFTILLNKVLTKAVTLDTVPTDSIKVFTKDTLNGTVSIKAHIKKFIDELEDNYSLIVAVSVKNGISNYTTEFVKTSGVLPPEGALPRKFTVGTGKKVFFSKGNLKYSKGTDWTDGTWGFFEHQYDYDPGTDNQSSDEYISLFYWGNTSSSNTKDHTVSVESCQSDGDNLPYEQDWGSRVLPEHTWRTLTKVEWKYILDIRDVAARFAKATVSSVSGILIFPDVFEWNTSTMGEEPAYNSHNTGFSPDYTDAQFAFMEEAGVAFLPYAGWREGSTVTIDCGLYWSSTSWGPDGAHALYFDEEYVNGADDQYRTYGFSVRLVADCE